MLQHVAILFVQPLGINALTSAHESGNSSGEAITKHSHGSRYEENSYFVRFHNTKTELKPDLIVK